jgi:hypothetical protein
MVPGGFFVETLPVSHAGGFRDEQLERELASPMLDDDGNPVRDRNGDTVSMNQLHERGGYSVFIIHTREHQPGAAAPESDVRLEMEELSHTKIERKCRRVIQELREQYDKEPPSDEDWITDEVDLARRAGVDKETNGESVALRVLADMGCRQPRALEMDHGKKRSYPVRVEFTESRAVYHDSQVTKDRPQEFRNVRRTVRPYPAVHVKYWPQVATPDEVRDSYKLHVKRNPSRF